MPAKTQGCFEYWLLLARSRHLVWIKDHVPVVVTEEDVEEHGSVESAVHARIVDAEKV